VGASVLRLLNLDTVGIVVCTNLAFIAIFAWISIAALWQLLLDADWLAIVQLALLEVWARVVVAACRCWRWGRWIVDRYTILLVCKARGGHSVMSVVRFNKQTLAAGVV
jgi:hypothetical protein